MLETITKYRYMELWVCNACTFHCGYCTLAESGANLDKTHLGFYKEKKNIHKIVSFFDTYSSPNNKWLISFTGGEPFLVPNLDLLITELINRGNRVCFYTNLSIPLDHGNYSWINKSTAESVDYFMCSFHPEWIAREGLFFERISKLKEMRVNPVVRFVGHPKLLYLLDKLDEKCRDAEVTLYPTTLFSRRYPKAYAQGEKRVLQKFMKGFSPLIQLEGGLDVTNLECRAGSLLFSANMPRGGDITPCISVDRPVIGNVLDCKLKEFSAPVKCFKKEKVCTCDIHVQQAIVINADDADNFKLIKDGAGRSSIDKWEEWKHQNNLTTTDKFFARQGGVRDDSILVYSNAGIRQNSIKTRLLKGLNRYARRLI